MPAKSVNNSAAEPDTRRFWHCPVCGVWRQVDSDGNVGDHFSIYGSCPGSGEPTAFTVSALAEEGQGGLPERVVELPRSVVRALQPGSRYRCENYGIVLGMPVWSSTWRISPLPWRCWNRTG